MWGIEPLSDSLFFPSVKIPEPQGEGAILKLFSIFSLY